MISQETFESFISEAVSLVPALVRERIENVAFVAEDEPVTPSARNKQARSRGLLLGLYEGVPLPGRGPYYSGVLPDKITIFKNAIERVAGPDPEKIRLQVHEVIFHEIAHYLGMNESAVRQWEHRRKKNQLSKR
ncbi:MAG: metallopeptidase family protein [Patescibacteria group bacterium]